MGQSPAAPDEPDSATYSVLVTITGTNDTPIANDDTGTVSEDGPAVDIDVLANDTDPDITPGLQPLSGIISTEGSKQ